MNGDKPIRIVQRSIFAIVGVVFLVAVYGKVLSPYEARFALMAVATEVVGPGHLGRVFFNGVIAGVALVEALLGLLLLFGLVVRFASVCSIVVLIGFTFFLWRLLLLPEVPSCGCVGGWNSDVESGRAQAVFGVARNICLVVLLGWAATRPRPPIKNTLSKPIVQSGENRPVGATAPGFTIVELLVTTVVIAILIGLAIPGLGAARSRAKETRHLSNTRQFLIALSAYASEASDRFPTAHSATGKNTDASGQPIPSSSVAPQSYLVRNTLQWTDPLYRSGFDLPAEGSFGPPDDLNPIRRTHYLLTNSAFAEPALFVDDPQFIPELLRVQTVTRTRHPASKGYLLVTHSDAWSADREALDPVLAGLGDGSASKRSPRAAALADPDGNAIGMPSWPVLWTRQGLEGQDF